MKSSRVDRVAMGAIVRNELRQLVRDPGGLLMLFAMPAMFIVILSVALQGMFETGREEDRLAALLHDEEGGRLGETLRREMEGTGVFRVTYRDASKESWDRVSAIDSLQRGETDVLVMVPPGATDALRLQGEATVEVVLDPVISTNVAHIAKSVVQTIIYGVTLDEVVKHVEEVVERRQRGGWMRRVFTDDDEASDAPLADAGAGPSVEAGPPAVVFDAGAEPVTADAEATGDSWLDLLDDEDDAGAVGQGGAGPNAAEPGGGQGGAGPSGAEPGGGGATAVTGPIGGGEGQGGGGDLMAELGLGPADRRGVTVKQYFLTRSGIEVMPNVVQQYVPGWTIFALFWMAQVLALNLFQEGESGIRNRIVASPVSSLAYLTGKLLPYLFVNCLQAVAMFAVGVWLLPLFGCPELVVNNIPALAVLTVCISLGALAFGTMVASFARSYLMIATVTATVLIIMAVLAGVMVPKFIMPNIMQQLSWFVPHGWALEGYLSVLVRDVGLPGILPHVGMLLLFAAVPFSVALWRQRARQG